MKLGTSSAFVGGLVLLLGLSAILPAQSADFSIGKGAYGNQQLATVESAADFETFTGQTNKVTGTITADPVKHVGTGTITIDATAIDTGIAMRNTHMQSPLWLDTAKFPTISFTATSSKYKGGDNYLVTGNFTLHGVTKTITVPVVAKYIPESPVTDQAGFKGDVIHIKLSFPITLSDYGIAIPAMAAGKVAPSVTIGLTAFAQSGL